jgi:hypothetical protein
MAPYQVYSCLSAAGYQVRLVCALSDLFLTSVVTASAKVSLNGSIVMPNKQKVIFTTCFLGFSDHSESNKIEIGERFFFGPTLAHIAAKSTIAMFKPLSGIELYYVSEKEFFSI